MVRKNKNNSKDTRVSMGTSFRGDNLTTEDLSFGTSWCPKILLSSEKYLTNPKHIMVFT